MPRDIVIINEAFIAQIEAFFAYINFENSEHTRLHLKETSDRVSLESRFGREHHRKREPYMERSREFYKSLNESKTFRLFSSAQLSAIAEIYVDSLFYHHQLQRHSQFGLKAFLIPLLRHYKPDAAEKLQLIANQQLPTREQIAELLSFQGPLTPAPQPTSRVTIILLLDGDNNRMELSLDRNHPFLQNIEEWLACAIEFECPKVGIVAPNGLFYERETLKKDVERQNYQSSFMGPCAHLNFSNPLITCVVNAKSDPNVIQIDLRCGITNGKMTHPVIHAPTGIVCDEIEAERRALPYTSIDNLKQFIELVNTIPEQINKEQQQFHEISQQLTMLKGDATEIRALLAQIANLTHIDCLLKKLLSHQVVIRNSGCFSFLNRTNKTIPLSQYLESLLENQQVNKARRILMDLHTFSETKSQTNLDNLKLAIGIHKNTWKQGLFKTRGQKLLEALQLGENSPFAITPNPVI